MKRFWARYLTAAALGCLLALWALTASAYYPPLQAWVVVEPLKVGVTYKVDDPKRGHVEYSAKYWENTVVDCKQDNGLMAWIFYNPGGYYFVITCVYDPNQGGFIEDARGSFASVPSQFTVKDGVVAFVVPSTYYPGHEMALYATYDPLKGWMWYFNDVGDGHDLTLLTKDGLVAIKSTWDTLPPNGPETIIRCDIYDPKLGKWGHGIGGDQTFFAHTIGPLSISNATLHFTETYLGQVANWVVGYRPDYQHPLDCPWSNILATNTLAYFVAQPTSGSSSPLWVWFTDMSIAGGTWSYNFGDATVISLARSPHHTYNFPGVFQVTQLVSLLGANSTYSQNISIGWPIMLKGKVPPFLYLLLLSD